MVSTDGKIAAVFGVLGIGLWLAALMLSENRLLRLGLLVGVGFVLPVLINKLRARMNDEPDFPHE